MHFDDSTGLDEDEIPRGKHPLTGKRGNVLVYEGRKAEFIGEVWVRQNVGDEIVRGWQRRGIKSRAFEKEAVHANEKTSPRVEIPRVVIETMRIETNHLVATDNAVYWYLFAIARLHGMHRDSHVVRVQQIAKYLGIMHLDRVRQSLSRLRKGEASYHFRGGRVRLPLFESVEFEGPDDVYFSLPEKLRDAVLDSRDYAWVDINALPRFRSKFSALVYLRLCHMAGQHEGVRKDWTLDRAQLLELFRLPKGIRTWNYNHNVSMVSVDINNISGPRRRFETRMEWPDAEEGFFRFSVTSAARKLKEVKPKRLTDEAYEQIADRSVLPLKPHQYPTVIRLRQAATLASVARPIMVFKVAELWRTDVYGANNYGLDVAGMPAAEFLRLIETEGANEALEHWVERRDFGIPVVAVRKGVGKPPRGVRKPAVETAVVVEDAHEDIELVDDLSLGDDYTDVRYIPADERPPSFADAPDVDDDDIDF